MPTCLGFDTKKVSFDQIPVVSDQDEEPRIPKEARKVLHRLAAEWADVEDCRALEVMQLKGAMTNEVYQIRWPSSVGGNVRKVLVRVYGEGVEVFFNRDDEIQTFECMSKHGQGPRLLGRFPNGRIEEFIHARVCYYNPQIKFLFFIFMKKDFDFIVIFNSWINIACFDDCFLLD